MAMTKVTRVLVWVALSLLLAGPWAAAEAQAAPADTPAAAAEAQAAPAETATEASEPEATPEQEAAPAETPAETAEEPAPAQPAEGETPAEAPEAEEPAEGETPAEAPEAEEPAEAPEAEEPAEAEAEPTGPAIVAIEVTGNEHIAADTILEACPLKVGKVYTKEGEEGADAAAKAIRDLGWFFSVTLSTRAEGDGVRLIINIVENHVIQGISFEGNTIYSDEDLREPMQTQPGTVLNRSIFFEDMAAIVDKYRAAGYSFAQVMPPDEIGDDFILVIPVMEGVIEAIRVEGNRKTGTYVITRELGMRVGHVYNRRVAQRDLQRLMNLDLFESVELDWDVGSTFGQVIVVMRIREKKTGLASVGLGYSSVEDLVGFVDVTESNWKGTAQLINVRVEFGGRSSYELGYYNPWIRPNRTSLRVGLYDKLILREAFTEDDSFLYDEERSGGNVTVSRPLSYATRIAASLRIDDVSATLAQDDDAPEDVQLLQTSKVRSVGLTLVNDTRDLIANPSRGGMNSFSIEQAGLLGGGAKFGKFGTDLRRYFQMGARDRIVAVRLLLGVTTGSPPFLEQFLVGGGETLRGYQNDRYPGRNMAILNLEYRFPVSTKSKLMGVVFADAGDAWGGAFAKRFGDENFTEHLGYGVGIRVVTPIGPLRLDYGIGSEGAETHFSVGHVF